MRTRPFLQTSLALAMACTLITACGKKAEHAAPASAPAAAAAPSISGTGQVNFSVKDVYAAALAIEDAVAAHEGFVTSSSVNSQAMQHSQFPAEAGKALRIAMMQTQGELQLRVPSAKAAAFLRSIAGHIEHLESRQLAANDVQFDLLRQQLEQARAQATAQELTQVASQAGRVADKNQTIAQRRQAAIEANEAQLNKLTMADQVDFATMTLRLSQAPFVRKSTVVDFDSSTAEYRPGFATRAAQALASGWAGLQSFAIGVLEAWPWVLAFIAVVALWRKSAWALEIKRRIQSRNAHERIKS